MKARTITPVLTVALLLVTGYAAAQGSLTPPGAPGATMKTLQQVEPRTPISSAPYTISQPGSYYLTTNLTSTHHGVVITASGVTLDLMGFTLSGDRGRSDYGVFLEGATNSAIRNVVVRNGIVRNFGDGVRAEYAQDSRFERLITTANSDFGVFLTGGLGGQCDGNTLADCTISGNGDFGVFLYGGIGGQCDGNTIANCTIRGNVDRGIYMGYANGNRVEGNHITGQTGTTTYGILSIHTTGNLIVRNTCVGQTINFNIDADDTYGPIVTSSGALPTTGAGAHPWANFSR